MKGKPLIEILCNPSPGDILHKPGKPYNHYRVHRVKGTAVWYLPSYYGHNPPRGVLRTAHIEEVKAWTVVNETTLRPWDLIALED